MNSADLLSAEARIGTTKIGVWGLPPQRVKGKALALLCASLKPSYCKRKKWAISHPAALQISKHAARGH
jgi:hypothetical protein